MRACCTSRRDEDGEDRSCIGVDDLFGRFWLRPNEATDAAQSSLEKSDEQARKERSAETVQRHTQALGSDPNLMCYMVSDAPEDSRWKSPPSTPAAGERKKQRAHHIPPNTVEGVPIETECFVGKVIVLYRPDCGFPRGAGSTHPYYRYFSKRRRTWEFRVQGRFKRVPKGDLYIGIVLKDFNYNQAVAAHSMIVKRAGMSLVKYDLYLSWGDRCEASKKPDAELSHLVTNMTAWDQIIVTKKGKAPPPLKGELHGITESGLNIERKEMGLADYTKAIEEVCGNINTQDTYTMCFWGVSQVIDILRWNFKIGTSISMARFFEDDPIHVAMYELDGEDKALDGGRHLEKRKRYYLDFMFWSNSVLCPRLSQRYDFLDAPEALERFSSAQCSSDGAFVTDGNGKPRVEEPSVTNGGGGSHWSLLASWSNRLRWIPESTCSGGCSAPGNP